MGVDKLDTDDAWGGQDGYRKKLQVGKIGKRALGGVNEGRKDHGFGLPAI